MNTQEFLDLLSESEGKALIFEYAPNEVVDKTYHITEVKNVYFDSVDCGGNTHSERQTIVQLWENPMEIKRKYMQADKALSILARVDKVKAMHRPAEIFFEYSNKKLPTSSYSVKSVEQDDDKVLLKLYVEATACKPIQSLKTVAAACCGIGSKCC